MDLRDCRRANDSILIHVPPALRLTAHLVDRRHEIVATHYVANSTEIARLHERHPHLAVIVDSELAPADATEIAAVGGQPPGFPFAVAFGVTARTNSLGFAAHHAASTWIAESLAHALSAIEVLRIRRAETIYVVGFADDLIGQPRDVLAVAQARIRRTGLAALEQSTRLFGAFDAIAVAGFPSPRSVKDFVGGESWRMGGNQVAA